MEEHIACLNPCNSHDATFPLSFNISPVFPPIISTSYTSLSSTPFLYILPSYPYLFLPSFPFIGVRYNLRKMFGIKDARMQIVDHFGHKNRHYETDFYYKLEFQVNVSAALVTEDCREGVASLRCSVGPRVRTLENV